MRPSITALAALLLLPSAGLGQEAVPGYTWQALGNGVYVHTRTDPLAGPLDGNSTVIVNDEDVFVVDTHINPAAARAVIARIREITDKPVTHVVNTHWHDDHTNGNHAYRQAFPEVEIVAHRATVAALEAEWPEMLEQRRRAYEAVGGRDVSALAATIQAEDPHRAAELRLFAGYHDALVSEMPSLEPVYPNVVFQDSLVFERGPRTILVRWMGPGNTDGDALVWLPQDGVLITGDVLVAPVPYAFDSPMLEWIGTLDRVAAVGAQTLVPGHGPVQRDRRYLDRVVSLLEATIAAVRDAHAAGADYGSLPEAVDLGDEESLFTQGDAARAHAWRSYYLGPGLASAWKSLGYPVPGGG